MKWPPYPKYQETGIEWLGTAPAHWDVDRLKWSLTGCINGTWGDDPDGANEITCIRVADFDRTRFRIANANFTVRSVLPSQLVTRALKPGDLLIEKSGGGELQPVGTVVLFDKGFPAVSSNFIARMPVRTGYDPSFLAYLHAYLYAVRVNTRSIKQNTGIQNLDSSAYLNERVALPPTAEQQTIAAFLDREAAKIDALIAKQQRLVELLQEKRKAIIIHAVTKGLTPTGSMVHTGVDWLGMVPAHWTVMSLGTVARLQRGFDLPDCIREEGRYPVVTSAGVTAFHSCPMVKGPGVVTGRYGTIGQVFYVDEDFWPLNTTLFVVDFKGNDPKFVRYLLMTLPFNMDSDKSAVPGVNRNVLHRLRVACPPVEEQAAIGDFVDDETSKIDSLMEKSQHAIDLLRERRASLISAAVTGKIDLRAAVGGAA